MRTGRRPVDSNTQQSVGKALNYWSPWHPTSCERHQLDPQNVKSPSLSERRASTVQFIALPQQGLTCQNPIWTTGITTQPYGQGYSVVILWVRKLSPTPLRPPSGFPESTEAVKESDEDRVTCDEWTVRFPDTSCGDWAKHFDGRSHALNLVFNHLIY